MAISNYDRVGKALELLKTGLQPYVEREMKAQHDQLWLQQAQGGRGSNAGASLLWQRRAGVGCGGTCWP
jgi:hypothetical protein